MHAWWSSIVEGLAFGLVMVMLPSMIYDQTLNARFMVEKGFGVEVPRKEDDGSFTGDDIVKSLKFTMVDDEGDVLSSRAKECVDVFGDRELHDLYNAEATIDLPSDHLRPYLKKAFDSLGQKHSYLVQNKQISSSNCIIFDYATYWVPSIEAKFGVSLLGRADAGSTVEKIFVLPSWITFPSTIAYSVFEAPELFDPLVIPDASGVSETYRFGKSIEGCQLVLIRNCKELESEWLQLLGQIYEKPAVPVGLLPSTEQRWHEAFQWLDRQDKGSVVYVSFGSEVKLSAAQVKEIAIGLEESKKYYK
ncbi:LOW QUALITY PROTEIN: putative UDP-rhamnose:rhamnosyltransferase 1 [Phalaenopsis equestris]|uniref:LOW QUALITY PROTEIN: putative UDP-rhamnose:rhamnosyltransferase 1 n=1 Tax=Phalaenopsis equestris TaxID=78828 RepID=UPI0009E2C83A|nr:LOW QUALITY PROTEIN: putative UDP-rhamnose:rhamnosyltransferase 1 [Phalaenopsis equestris]